MSNLSEMEINELRHLPPMAAVKLEGCEGPGWSVAAEGVTADLYPTNPWPNGRRGRLWLPVSEATIVDLVVEHTGKGRNAVWEKVLSRHQEGVSTRTAALRLLAHTFPT